ncbi:vitamin B12 ABC transporter permease BtuC [Halorussus sp. MSC15.2]|uniref:vitamin B12 ABC transporter permease BtuC n=1 Tax=Halorussus sp. MSC15.2 TaxID=2283638 RepID=UPI0013D04C49|nr:vitamin B12 ABC transporter permease BtuC [Halorussus sp. MSC15.2]NEU59246.1 vitamin B12 ABC transporter permease BtuC [Halorussus sp. MSC15.2]
MRQGARVVGWSSGLAAALGVVVVVSAAVGPVPIDYLVVAKVLLNALAVPAGVGVADRTLRIAGLAVTMPVPTVEFAPIFHFAAPDTARTIVMTLRLPRIALGAVVGLALSTAGVVMQGFFRNPMADPSIIGVSSGAAVGAVATIALPLAVPFSLPTAAFVGAIAAAFGVYVLATEDGRTPVATLLLAGVAVQTFLGAVVSFLLLQTGESMERAVFWLMGHLHLASWEDVRLVLPVAVLGFAVLMAYARDLNVLLLGEEDAHALGVEVEWTKRLLLAVASVMTGAAVAVTGVIGFVGLVVPHVMRLLVGPDHRILLPTSALAGATFLVATDTVARSGTAELPVGIVTAFLGAPFFLYLLRKREVHAL